MKNRLEKTMKKHNLRLKQIKLIIAHFIANCKWLWENLQKRPMKNGSIGRKQKIGSPPSIRKSFAEPNPPPRARIGKTLMYEPIITEFFDNEEEMAKFQKWREEYEEKERLEKEEKATKKAGAA